MITSSLKKKGKLESWMLIALVLIGLTLYGAGGFDEITGLASKIIPDDLFAGEETIPEPEPVVEDTRPVIKEIEGTSGKIDPRWSAIFLTIFIPAFVILFRRKETLADDYSVKQLAQYGLAGKRAISVTSEVHDRYPGLKNIKTINLKEGQRKNSHALRASYDLGKEVSDLIAYAGNKRLTILTPKIMPEEIKNRFPNIRFLNPGMIKELRELKTKEAVELVHEKKDVSVETKGSSVKIGETKVPESAVQRISQLEEAKEQIEVHKTLASSGLMQEKTSEDLDKLVNDIEGKIKDIKEEVKQVNESIEHDEKDLAEGERSDE